MPGDGNQSTMPLFHEPVHAQKDIRACEIKADGKNIRNQSG